MKGTNGQTFTDLTVEQRNWLKVKILFQKLLLFWAFVTLVHFYLSFLDWRVYMIWKARVRTTYSLPDDLLIPLVIIILFFIISVAILLGTITYCQLKLMFYWVDTFLSLETTEKLGPYSKKMFACWAGFFPVFLVIFMDTEWWFFDQPYASSLDLFRYFWVEIWFLMAPILLILYYIENQELIKHG